MTAKPFLRLAALRRMQPGWERLAAGRASPMQQYAWAEAFAATYWEYGDVVVMHTGPEQVPTALAAFVRPHGGGPLEALGVKQLFEPMDFLHESAEALEALVRLLKASGEAVHLPRIPADSPAVPAFSRAYRAGTGFVRRAPTNGYPVLALDEGWKEPESRLNAGRRSDLRRARRKAERFGAISFELKLPTPVELPSLLDEAWLVEGAGWKGARGSALHCDPLRGPFFRRFAGAVAARGMLRLAFMRIDHRPIAMQLAIESDDRLWLLKIGYDERYATCSPGQQLMCYVAGMAARRGLKSIEFLGEEEAWTRMWTDKACSCVSLRAFPFTTLGVSALASNAMRYAARRVGLA